MKLVVLIETLHRLLMHVASVELNFLFHLNEASSSDTNHFRSLPP